MSYGIIPYRVDIFEMESLFGRLKGNAYRKALSTISKDLIRLDHECEERVKAKDIFDDYAKGEINHPDLAHLYWYVFKVMCSYFGHGLPNSKWYPSSSDKIEALNSIKNYVISHRFLPMVSDFPTVYICWRDDFKKLSEEVDCSTIDAGQIRELKRWISFADMEKQDIVLFYH